MFGKDHSAGLVYRCGQAFRPPCGPATSRLTTVANLTKQFTLVNYDSRVVV